jgi:energy-coupling factor transporter ATP-binding protein EcfA2
MGIAIALAGNPKSGKTTLFNVLTGARQHVGNYNLTVWTQHPFRKFYRFRLFIFYGTGVLLQLTLDKCISPHWKVYPWYEFCSLGCHGKKQYYSINIIDCKPQCIAEVLYDR